MANDVVADDPRDGNRRDGVGDQLPADLLRRIAVALAEGKAALAAQRLRSADDVLKSNAAAG